MIETAEAGGNNHAEEEQESLKGGAEQTAEMPVSKPSNFHQPAKQQQQQQQHHNQQRQQQHQALHQHPSTMLMIHSLRDCYQALDAEMVLVTLGLFLLSVIVLSPRGSLLRGFSLKRRRCIPGDSHHHLWGTAEDDSEGLSSNRTITTNSTNGLSGDEEATEEEQFEQLWPAIRTCGYRRLVLPPECRLVDIPAFMKEQREELKVKHSSSNSDEEKKKHSMDNDADHPLMRLKGYSDDLFHLLRNFLSYDYMGAGRMLINWIQYWLRLKSRKPHEVEVEEDDDDMSVSTEGQQQRRHNNNHERMDLSLLHQHQSEEKKDDTNLLTSTSSEYGSVSSQEQLTTENSKPPVSPKCRLSRGTSGKKKDALDSYRSTSKQPVVNMNNPPVMTTAPLTPTPLVPFTPPVSPETLRAPLPDTSESPSDSSRTRMFSGSMRFFDTAQNKASLRRMHVEVPMPDLHGYILGDDFLPNTRHTPLLVFVNSRSGPQQGRIIIKQLRHLLNPIQVWDLADGSPERVLESFCAFSRLRILICGGDGTVSWIISCLENMQVERWPPIAILPLGTGNDLARIHGWGGGYTNESLIEILEKVAESYISLLDQWEMKIENKKGKVKAIKSFFNYVGVGADATAALQVHMLRESKPQLFFSRIFNKMWYFVFGAEEAIKESNINLPNEITLIADGVEVPLPPDSQGVILLNIDSYCGGVPIWSHGEKGNVCYIDGDSSSIDCSSPSSYKEPEPVGLNGTISPRRVRSMGNIQNPSRVIPFDRVDSVDDFLAEDEDKYSQMFSCDRPSSCQDGKLDIVSVRGTFHLGQIQVGLGNATKLCQASEVKIIMKKQLATQIDGEPWRQSACTMTISRKKDQAVMLHRSADESGGVETEMAKLLDWAEDRKVIDRNVHSVLMKEYSRRIESKTRQRRVRSQDNLMLTLKRAIASGGQHSSQAAFPGTLSF